MARLPGLAAPTSLPTPSMNASAPAPGRARTSRRRSQPRRPVRDRSARRPERGAIDPRVLRALTCAALLAAFLAAPAAHAASPAPINHVWILWLENEDYDATFGPDTKIPDLARDLPAKGALLTQSFATGHNSLDNYITVVSGQPPNPVTQADCQTFQEFLPGTLDSNGVALGQGCVYPTAVKTIADQLEDSGLSWKGYMDDMKTTCRHPAINAHDETQSAKVGDRYATRHNPFVYFHSIIDRSTCAANDVP